MKPLNYLRILAIILSVLVISLPITLAQELNLVYDANGNLVTGDSFYREYNELNQLSRIREGNISNGPILEEFIWHPIAEEILIKDVFYNGIKNYTIYYVSDDFIRIENSSGNYTEKYIYQDGILVAQVTTDGNKEFLHNDHEGSSTLITDINGNVIENSFYSPFGEIIGGGKSSRFDYEGKEFDSLVDDVDFHFRKYKPQWGKFTQPDTLIQNVYDPQSLNRYAFERNNAYKYVDPSGHIVDCVVGCPITATATIAYVVGGIFVGTLIAGVISGGIPPIDTEGVKNTINQIADMKTKIEISIDALELAKKVEELGKTQDPEKITQLKYEIKIKSAEIIEKIATSAALKASFGDGSGFIELQQYASGSPSVTQVISTQKTQEVNQAKAVTSGGGGSGGSSGTNTLGKNTPQQAIKAAGGSTLKTETQRAASEALAAKIINKQRAAAKKSSSKKR